MVKNWLQHGMRVWLGVVAMHATCLAQEPDSSPDRQQKLQAEIAQVETLDPTQQEGATALAGIIEDRERDIQVRIHALERCIADRTDSPQIRDALVKIAATDPEAALRGTAAYGFSNAGVPPEVGVPVLMVTLEDDAFYGPSKSATSLRDQAAYALGNYGPAAQAALPKLLEFADDNPKHFRPFVNESTTAIESALGQIAPQQYPFYAWGEPAVLPLASLLVDSDDVEVRRAAAVSLHAQQLDVVNPAADALRRALEDADEQTRFYSALTLVRLGDRGRAVEELLPAQHSENAALRERLAENLGQFDPRLDGTEQILRQMLEDESLPVRQYAVRSFNDAAIWFELLPHPDVVIRIAAAARLIQNKVHFEEAFETLHEVLKGPHADATYPAISAMRGLPADIRAPSNVTLVRLIDGPQKYTVMIATKYLVELKEPTPELRSALVQAAKKGSSKAQRVLDAWDRREEEAEQTP
jgi:HEAT repeat protein